MKLVLTLVGPPRLMGARLRSELQAGSLSVGRSPEADWVLPDVDRLISRLHLRVDASYGAFILTDTSSNGVYVNGSDEPVGYGASVKLGDGDRLRVGEAQIAVAIEAHAADRPIASSRRAAAAATADVQHRGAVGEAPRDPLGGPFGPEVSSPDAGRPASSGSRIDANWMNPPTGPSADGPTDSVADRPDSVILPLRPGRPLLPTRLAAPGSRSTLDLVEALPDLSARDLAAAVDAAGREIDQAAWREFRRRVGALLGDDHVVT